MTTRMALTDLSMATMRGDWKAAWDDLLRCLPTCCDCSRPSSHVLREHPQQPPIYACSEHVGTEPAWDTTPWVEHVLVSGMRRGK